MKTPKRVTPKELVSCNSVAEGGQQYIYKLTGVKSDVLETGKI